MAEAIIVGAGPAGLFAALELSLSGIQVLVI
ncbi:MAG: FAD-binding protein, partial [Methanothrix sp.]|nr:FAD-binding protein [Methanothrix sp.]